jgi:hypothetical protein
VGSVVAGVDLATSGIALTARALEDKSVRLERARPMIDVWSQPLGWTPNE